MSSKAKIPSKWHVPDGFVLTWYPPFKLRGVSDPNHPINVYDDSEPFVRIDGGPADGGYNPNTRETTLAEFDGLHPGVYALNLIGEENQGDALHPDAIQIYGKKV